MQCPTSRRQSLFKNTYLLIFLALCSILTIYKVTVPVFVDLKDRDLLDIRKCPACYGVNMCPSILTGDVRLIDWSQYTIRRLVNARNIYFGMFKTKPIVLKKLAHDWELDELDRRICTEANYTYPCPIDQAMRQITRVVATAVNVPDIGGGISRHKEYHILAEKLKNGSDFLYCPSERKTQYIMEKVLKKNWGQNQITIIENMITLMMINEETLIVQAFPEEEGFPFPKYHGACGRLVIEEFVNRTIADFAYESWETRAAVALKLLNLAEEITNISGNFSLYWTDVTEHNVGIDANGKIKILDAENIVMVDKEEVEKLKADNWDVPFTSVGVGCDKCFSFSIDDLCHHRKTDHNIYALCHGLLSPGAFSQTSPEGLLFDTPDYVLSEYPEFPVLLRECQWPSRPGGRFSAAQKLRQVLSAYRGPLTKR